MKFRFIICLLSVFLLSCVTKMPSIPERSLRETANIGSFELGTVWIGVNTSLLGTKVESQESTISYHPRTDEISIFYIYQANKMNIYLDRRSREQFIESVGEYINEFQNKKLQQVSARKTKKMYGYGRALLEWQLFLNPARSEPVIRFGYIFIGRNVYYTITANAAENIHEISIDVIPESPEHSIYLTIAQATQLVEILDEQNIRINLLKELDDKNINNDPDTYTGNL